jgi:hypothetical protein
VSDFASNQPDPGWDPGARLPGLKNTRLEIGEEHVSAKFEFEEGTTSAEQRAIAEKFRRDIEAMAEGLGVPPELFLRALAELINEGKESGEG